MLKTITSPSNPLIKKIVKLRKDKKFRKAQNQALIVGKNILNELKNFLIIDTLIVSNKREIKDFKAKKVLLITEKIMKKITNVKSPEKIAAIVNIPFVKPKEKNYILILEQLLKNFTEELYNSIDCVLFLIFPTETDLKHLY